MSRKLLHQGQILGPGGLPQGVLEWAVLEELRAGQWSGVAGAYFPQSRLHHGRAAGGVDRKVSGSSPGRSGGRIFFSRVNFLC